MPTHCLRASIGLGMWEDRHIFINQNWNKTASVSQDNSSKMLFKELVSNRRCRRPDKTIRIEKISRGEKGKGCMGNHIKNESKKPKFQNIWTFLQQKHTDVKQVQADIKSNQ